MKKGLKLLLTLMLAGTLFACTKTAKADPLEKMSLEQIFTQIYENTDAELPKLGNTEVTKENEVYYLGVEGLDYKEALASEPLMTSQAYSVVLVRMNNASDVEEAKKLIKENVNPRKWICVEVDEKNVLVENAGNVIILIMTDQSASIKKAFDTVVTKAQ